MSFLPPDPLKGEYPWGPEPKLHFPSLGGLPLYMVKDKVVRRQYRFPRSKKKRIRKKWANNPKNFKLFIEPLLYDNQLIKTPHGFFANPRMYEKILKLIGAIKKQKSFCLYCQCLNRP